MKTSEVQIRFGEPGWHLTILLQCDVSNSNKYDWYRDHIQIVILAEAGEFKTRVSTHLRLTELVYLHKLLSDVHRRAGEELAIHFRLDEALLDLAFRANKQGHVDVDILIVDDPVPRARLAFTIQADQTYLPIWMNSIREGLACFQPIPGTATRLV